MDKINLVDLESFIQALDWQELLVAALPHFDHSSEKADNFLSTLKEESKLGLKFILPYLKPGQKILEVGSGMGLLSGFLKSNGLDITALEPGLGGFGMSWALAIAIQKHPGFSNLKRLDIPVQDLGPKDSGTYDLIFSVNVLEHIPQLTEAVVAMKSVLNETGVMVHTCPNYTVPYEPHFGIPLIPFFPHKTTLFKSTLKESELWGSLNFITATEIKNICTKHDLIIHFEKGVMYNTFKRLEEDVEFQKRQAGTLAGSIFKGLKYSGLLRLIRKVPAVLSTPMVFEMKHDH